MVKSIPLTQGQYAIVDDEDFETLNLWKWFAQYDKALGAYYARRAYNDGARINMIPMHREITGALKGEVVDHINHNTLDNRKSNLRVCSHKENCRNRKVFKNNRAGYKGVIYREDCNRWRSILYVDKKQINIGHFKDPITAALMRDCKAEELFPEFTGYNYPSYVECGNKDEFQSWLKVNEIGLYQSFI